ncbi:hypothetical protein ACTU6V_12265 [Microbacterium sp. A204]|uniref:hypothetical protein n=1 Tax=Microbacterium sp. A204 TaxID=3457321 RepID=UPI003FD4CD8C
MVDVVITIRATVPIWTLVHMFEEAKNNTPQDGILNFEVDGSENREIGGQS